MKEFGPWNHWAAAWRAGQGLYLLDLEAPTPQLGLNLLFQLYQQRDIHLLPTLCPCHPWSLDILLPF